MVEIFAGSARLASVVRDAGLQGIAVDYDKSRSNGPHIALFDLDDPPHFSALKTFLRKEKHRIVWAHFAPSCGTASRAREWPIKNLQKKGFKVPKPLISDPMISLWVCRTSLELTNLELKRRTSCMKGRLNWLNSWGIAISIVNPLNSIFWLVPCIRTLVSSIHGFDALFDHCCHGG